MHVNQPTCAKCTGIVNRYPNVHPQIAAFITAFRAANPDAHLSAVGRDKVEQEDDFARKVSRAWWMESPHNYNAACDFWRLTLEGASFDREWFRGVLGPAARAAGLTWGGDFKSILDMPHCEVTGWSLLAQQGLLTLVEE